MQEAWNRCQSNETYPLQIDKIYAGDKDEHTGLEIK